MKTWIPLFALLLLPLTLAAVASGQSAEDRPADATAGVERGRYLVHRVAMCVECHTPRDREGHRIDERLLQGAPIPVASPFPEPWAYSSPQIAGLPGFQREDVVTLLMTGRRPNGEAPLPPMPSFRMSREDATAVVAYLKSLGGSVETLPEEGPSGESFDPER